MLGIATGTLVTGAGCAPPPDDGQAVYNNTTDPTNGGARHLGAAACASCHPDVAAVHALHGHAHILKPILGDAPGYPSEADGAGVPNPPSTFTWQDIAYVVGGYVRKARFIDQDGFLLTTGTTGQRTQWNLLSGPTGAMPVFVEYEASTTAPKPYAYDCFVCHTTGPAPQDSANPLSQDNRPGLVGTWQEPGVQCEACHGPGSNHVSNPGARMLYVNASAVACGACHNHSPGSDSVIHADDGFILYHQQYSELRASGAHAGFACTTCHDPHAGTAYDTNQEIRNTCTACHAGKNMALHENKIYVRNDYTEPLSCESCHMPFATRSATSAIVGESRGRVGDTRTHIFRINTSRTDYLGIFSSDLSAVRKDSQGRAAVTLDYVCLRCHNTENGYPFKLSLKSASDAAPGLHGFQ